MIPYGFSGVLIFIFLTSLLYLFPSLKVSLAPTPSYISIRSLNLWLLLTKSKFKIFREASYTSHVVIIMLKVLINTLTSEENTPKGWCIAFSVSRPAICNWSEAAQYANYHLALSFKLPSHGLSQYVGRIIQHGQFQKSNSAWCSLEWTEADF